MSSQDQKKGASMEKSDFESTQEFYDQWVNMYKTTMGKLVEMPAVGPAREKSEKMMKGFSTFINLYAAGMDTSSNMQNVFKEAMQKVQEKIGKDMDGDVSPEKYKEFYDIWIQTYSETFKDFARSGHFVSDLGKLNAHLMDFQKYNREMLEDNYLKPMNMPTKTEIDEINKELYTLKKTVKELTRQVKELKENK
jgi:class III poly(R)-hydroxyalkanoic acid synthase PhaE subunit